MSVDTSTVTMAGYRCGLLTEIEDSNDDSNIKAHLKLAFSSSSLTETVLHRPAEELCGVVVCHILANTPRIWRLTDVISYSAFGSVDEVGDARIRP